jgi:hypothetical protein
MKIYFSQVPAEDVDNFGDEGLFGPNQNGDYFYNQVEFGTNPGGTDEVAISDGCNRYMPISTENIPELIAALTQIQVLKRVIDLGNTTSTLAESDTEAYVHEHHVHFDRESLQDAVDSAAY